MHDKQSHYSHDPVVEDATGLHVVLVSAGHGGVDALRSSDAGTESLAQPPRVHVLQRTRLQNSKDPSMRRRVEASLFREALPTHLGETEDAFVEAVNGCADHTAEVAGVHFEHLAVGQPQCHQAGQLGGFRRHLAGALVGVVAEVIAAVQVGAVVGVALRLLLGKAMQTKFNKAVTWFIYFAY